MTLRLLAQVRDLCLEYLFPRSAEEEKLLSLSPAEFVRKLPHATHISGEVSALFEYAHGGVNDLVWQVKYKGDRAVAAKLGVLLYDALVAELEEGQLVEKYGPPLIVPMPTSAERRVVRGWNQAELLVEGLVACDVAQTFQYESKALRKVRHTESQTKTQGRKERLENLKDSMEASSQVAERLVVVIDDVYTTGATFTEAKRALLAAGARRVISISVAH